MAEVILNTTDPFLIWPASGKPAVIFNHDPDNDIIVGPNPGLFPTEPSGVEGGVLSNPNVTIVEAAGGQLVVDGSEDTYGLCIPDGNDSTATVSIISGATSLFPGAVSTAAALVSSGLAEAIAVATQIALETGGLSLTGNPVQLYNAGPSTPTIGGAWGATVFTGSGGVGSKIQNFETITGTTVTGFKIFGLPSLMSVAQIKANPQMAYAIANPSITAFCCFQPAVDGSDAANLTTTWANFKTAGLTNVRITFYNEWGDSGITVAQIQNVYSSYYPAAHAAFPGAVVYNNSGSAGAAKASSGDPFPNYDIFGFDLYTNTVAKNVANQQVSAFIAIAHSHNVPWGRYEMGATTGGSVPPVATVNADINNTATLVTQDLTAGKPVDFCMWYWGSTLNDPTNYVTAIENLANALTPSLVPVQVAAGATLVFTPLTPSPVAGLASASFLSYDIAVTLTAAAAGSTNPYCKVKIFWYNQDNTTGVKPIDTIQWTMPIGNTSGTGTSTTGRGFMRARYMKVEITNEDTIACNVQCQINGTSRDVQKDDWRWDAINSNNVPGVTLVPAGAPFENCLGIVNGVSCPAGSSISFLCSLYAGSVYVRFGTPTAGNFITVQLSAQPSSDYKNEPLLNELLSGPVSSGPGDFTQVITLPRAPCLITFTNSDTSAHPCHANLVALD